MTDFETWALDNSDRIFRYWVYKKTYTPYEEARQFSDQSCFEDYHCKRGVICEAIELPDGDILLGFVDPFEEAEMDSLTDTHIEYYKLSEIRMVYDATDDKELDALWEEYQND